MAKSSYITGVTIVIFGKLNYVTLMYFFLYYYFNNSFGICERISVAPMTILKGGLCLG